MAASRPRVIVPEILDGLDARDPEAVRSRRDLRVIDLVLRGTAWICSRVRRESGRSGIVELGAGDGRLCRRLAAEFPGCRVTGLDLVPRPAGLPGEVGWCAGDFFETLRTVRGDIVVGNLVLHHFGAEALEVLGRELRRFRVVIFSEPWRSRWALGLSALASPFAGRVTRHDMPASIRAGFRTGEMARELLCGGEGWKIAESVWPCGAIRFQAWRDI